MAIFDLEERTFQFAKRVSLFCKTLKKTESNRIYCSQLIRSSSSVGANYIEANEKIGKKDFLMRAKISRKEAKESMYWLRLIIEVDGSSEEGSALYKEAKELKLIFSSIIEKTEAVRI